MSRYAPAGASYSFGPGPLTPAVRAIIYANLAIYVLGFFARDTIVSVLGLWPAFVLERGFLWQLGTYLFVHAAEPFHILFNLLGVWMFGVELERRWGTRGFVTYYAITGIGAGVCVVLVSLLPFAAARAGYGVPVIGASGAVYGLLLAWALLFPHRQILFLFFPLPARVAAMIIGAIAFFSALGASGTGTSHLAHLGGLLIGWLYLKGPRDLKLSFQYRLTKWRMERMRRKFSVHKGGRIH